MYVPTHLAHTCILKQSHAQLNHAYIHELLLPHQTSHIELKREYQNAHENLHTHYHALYSHFHNDCFFLSLKKKLNV